jgi:hypothetical protein
MPHEAVDGEIIVRVKDEEYNQLNLLAIINRVSHANSENLIPTIEDLQARVLLEKHCLGQVSLYAAKMFLTIEGNGSDFQGSAFSDGPSVLELTGKIRYG